MLDVVAMPDQPALRVAVLTPKAGEATGQRPLLFIPGLGGTVKASLEFLEGLTGAATPVYGLDPRGMGLNEGFSLSNPPEADYASFLDDLTRCLEWIKTRHNGQTPYIAGLSLGGIFASLLQLRYPNGPGLILMSPAFAPHPKLFTWGFRLNSIARMLLKGGKARISVPFAVNETTRNEVKRADPELQIPGSFPPHALFAMEFAARKTMRELGKIQAPVLMLVPEEDIVCAPVAMQSAYARFPHPGKALHVYPGLYHDLTSEPEAHLIQADIVQWINFQENGVSPLA